MFFVLIALCGIASIFEALEEISVELAPFLNSDAGMLITIAVTALITYRWYRNRHSVERG